jgi:hypothetical protein
VYGMQQLTSVSCTHAKKRVLDGFRASPAAPYTGVNNVCFFLNLNNLMSLIGTERKLESGYCWAFIWSAVER